MAQVVVNVERRDDELGLERCRRSRWSCADDLFFLFDLDFLFELLLELFEFLKFLLNASDVAVLRFVAEVEQWWKCDVADIGDLLFDIGDWRL